MNDLIFSTFFLLYVVIKNTQRSTFKIIYAISDNYLNFLLKKLIRIYVFRASDVILGKKMICMFRCKWRKNDLRLKLEAENHPKSSIRRLERGRWGVEGKQGTLAALIYTMKNMELWKHHHLILSFYLALLN